jgi:hypothetical protein
MVAQSVSRLLKDKVSVEIECIDRLYLNGYVPGLQTPGQFVAFIQHLGKSVYSTSSIEPMTRAFLSSIERYIERHGLEVVQFKPGQRKDDIAQERLRKFKSEEGVLFVGRAQEKAWVFTTEKRRDPRGHTYPWIVRSTRIPNHFYFYIVDRDFGPLFIKFCTYAPYAVKVCLNGHEWLKRQLDKKGICYESLDNGILSCAAPERVQRIARGLTAEKIDRVIRKWFARLPHPFSPRDRQAGYRYDISVLQAEFSLTQVFDRPETGRAFFEEIVRENIDLGRPEYVQLVFQRKIIRRTPGSFRTRVITHDVVPSLHFQYKHTFIKQYHKLGRALRTETTINDASDFNVGKRLFNLPALAEIGFNANRRLLDVQSLTHDCTVGADRFDSIVKPVECQGQRASALRFGEPRVMALLQAILMFVHLPVGFSNRTLRERLALLLGLDPAQLTPGMMTYDLRRLRLHGVIERVPHTHRYRLTPEGIRVALFFTRAYARLLRPTLSLSQPEAKAMARRDPTSAALARVEASFDHYLELCRFHVA